MFNLETLGLMINNINCEIYEQVYPGEVPDDELRKGKYFDFDEFKGLDLLIDGDSWVINFAGQQALTSEDVCSVDDGGEDTLNDIYNKISIFINEYVQTLNIFSLSVIEKEIENEKA